MRQRALGGDWVASGPLQLEAGGQWVRGGHFRKRDFERVGKRDRQKQK